MCLKLKIFIFPVLQKSFTKFSDFCLIFLTAFNFPDNPVISLISSFVAALKLFDHTASFANIGKLKSLLTSCLFAKLERTIGKIKPN